jgi:hypothetical protein
MTNSVIARHHEDPFVSLPCAFALCRHFPGTLSRVRCCFAGKIILSVAEESEKMAVLLARYLGECRFVSASTRTILMLLLLSLPQGQGYQQGLL